ncbi:tyramine beta-hydroxylase [Bacillus rossius redtenbacheri]|uniref:tyramine beta-hydroxylase n=1 Tax=Bacillus rossius redtenbacheri TaxID=93214 RepID=UPI002FDDDE98
MWPLLLLLLAGAGAEPRVFRVPLDAQGRASLSWLLDPGSRSLQAEVHARDLPAAAWFAVGFSDHGEAWPADYCVLWTDWRGHTHLQDAWAGADGRLSVDAQQDCGSFQFVRRRNVTKFAFTRAFDTCDDRDYIIEDGTTHVVWAWGRGPLYRLAGVHVADASSRGMQRAQLLKTTAPAASLPEGTFGHEVVAQSVHVPADETTYWCHVHRLPDSLAVKHHVVQFEATIQAGNEGLVHHMEVFHCEAPPSEVVPEYRGPCFAPSRPAATQVCKRVLAAWAMGAPPFVYPEEAGLPIGGPDFNPYVMLEIHYNNPEKKSDWVDSSGVRLHISPRLRAFDGGVLELGLEYSDKMAVPPGQRDFPLSGYCISECTAVGIPPEGIVVFGSQLHTHLTGSRVFTRHFRDGTELPELNRDDHYSTHFQEIRLLKRPVRVLPGDALVTTCWYRTQDRSNVTLGGFSISEEMCVNYVHYFPKVDLEVCKSSISDQALQTYFRFLREWEGQPTSPQQGVSDNYRAVQWTPMRAHVLSEVYRESPLSMQCNQSSGERFPGYWENLPHTPELRPLPPPPRRCAAPELR